jgi:aspartyl-tRNA(Asn)/glutamyl-tRNA(Gln) amidotransferase subunit A
MALCWTLDKLGPMCRTAADCGLVFNAIAGRDPLDPTSREKPSVREAVGRGRGGRARPRIAVLKDSYEKTQPAVRENFQNSLKVLKQFADIEMDVKLPEFPYGAAVGTIVKAEGASAFRDLIETGRVKELASPRGRAGGYSALILPAVDYLHAMRLRAPMRRAWAQFFTRYALLVAPSRSTVAYPINKTFDQAYPDIGGASPIASSNLVGVPALSVPNGFGENNLPTGIQFVGPAWSESALIEIADKYQQSTDWHKRRPTL